MQYVFNKFCGPYKSANCASTFMSTSTSSSTILFCYFCMQIIYLMCWLFDFQESPKNLLKPLKLTWFFWVVKWKMSWNLFFLKKSICFVVKWKTHPKYPKTKEKKNAFEKYLVYVHWCYLQAHYFCNNIWKLLLGVFVLFRKD